LGGWLLAKYLAGNNFKLTGPTAGRPRYAE